jgi:hypothetical protein
LSSFFCQHIVQIQLIEFGVALQMAVEDGQVMAYVHITPMRASRALALRYLATKFGIDMENVTVCVLASTFSPLQCSVCKLACADFAQCLGSGSEQQQLLMMCWVAAGDCCRSGSAKDWGGDARGSAHIGLD